MKLSAEQRDALDCSCPVLVRAGAGSGKTAVLVERIRHILNQGYALPSEIVAITFTRKAAAEMKSRLAESWRRDLEHCDDENQQRRLHECLTSIDDMAVMTMDAYLSRLVRHSARFLNLDPNFEVCDPTRRVSDIRQVVMAEMARHPEEVAVLAGQMGGRAVVWRSLSQLLAQRFRLQEWLKQHDKCNDFGIPLSRWVACLQEQSLLSHEAAALQQAWDVLQRAQPKKPDRLSQVVDLIQEHLAPPFDVTPPLPLVQELLRQDGQAKSMLKMGQRSQWDDIEVVRQACQEIAKVIADRAVFNVSLDTEDEHSEDFQKHFHAFSTRCLMALEISDRHQQRLDFSNLLEKACQLLEGPEGHHLRISAKHLLVDEFQDTSPPQWHFIRQFSELGSDHGPRLFLVGDAKQSIYAFRDADVRVFNQAQQAVLDRGGRVIDLKTSYRSTPSLLKVVDWVCGRLFDRPRGHAEYESPHQVLQAADPSQDVPRACSVIAPTVKHSFDKRDEAEAVVAWLKSRNQDRASTAILYRSRASQVLLEQALLRAEIPYQVEGGIGLYEQAEVRDAIMLLRTCVNPRDDWALACLLRSPWGGLSDPMLFKLRQNKDQSLNQVLFEWLDHHEEAEQTLIEEAQRHLKKARALSSWLDPAALIRHMMEDHPFSVSVRCGPEGSTALGNLALLCDECDQLSGQGMTFDQVTEELWQRVKARVRQGTWVENGNADLQLMTVHQSKGLEFDQVVVFGFDEATRSDSEVVQFVDTEEGWQLVPRSPACSSSAERPLWQWLKRADHARAQAEKERLLYVAMTRARSHCVLSTRFKGGTSSRVLSGFLSASLATDELPEDQDAIVLSPTDSFECEVFPLASVESNRSLDMEHFEPKVTWFESEHRVLSRHEHLSPSKMGDFVRCPRYYQWRHRVGVPQTQHTSPVFSQKELSGELIASEYGQAVHEALEKWDGFEDAARLCQRLAYPDIVQDVQQALDNQELRTYLQHPQAKREWGFQFDEGNLSIRGAIDLLVNDGTSIHVIDYKCNALRGRAAQDLIAERGYDLQIALYAQAVRRWFGSDLPIQAKFYFVKNDQWIESDTEKLQADISQHLSQLSDCVDQSCFPKRDEKSLVCRDCDYFGICHRKEVLML